MKRAIVLLVVCWSGLVMLQGCSLPLVGSITGNSLTAAVTGNYERSLVNGGIDLIVHQKTGKTTSQHLYQVAETKYTEKVLKKHFPNKKITIKDFKLGYNNTTHPIIGPTQASEILNFKSTTHPIIGHDRASDILNFKYLFVSAAFSSVFISLDIIFQYTFGFNIIGLKSIPDIPGSYAFGNAGFFGNVLIAGGFIKNFSFFSIFFVAFITKNKNNIRFLLIMLTICTAGMAILFSGDRMPLILFVFGLLLIFLLNNKLKKVLSVSLIVLFINFGLLSFFDKKIEKTYSSHSLLSIYQF